VVLTTLELRLEISAAGLAGPCMGIDADLYQQGLEVIKDTVKRTEAAIPNHFELL